VKVELEIGTNLRSSIETLTKECVSEGFDPGIGIKEAFGIDFSKAILDNPELQQNLELTIEKKESEE